MDTFLQDLRFGARALWKQRTLSVAAVITLGVCIAAATAVFCILNAIVLRSLPFDEPDRLVFVHNSYPRAGVEVASSSIPDYVDRRKEKDIFEEVAIFRTQGRTVGQAGNAERLTAMVATPSLFKVLRVKPFIGRAFSEQDGEIGQERKVILSYELWQRLLGGRPDVVGRDLRMDEVPYTIVGVMPADFRFWAADVRAWIPAAFTAEQRSDQGRHSNGHQMVARLKAGVTVARAQKAIDAINLRNLDLIPALKPLLIEAGYHSTVLPLQEFLVRDVRRTLYLLWGGSLFVLLIGCVNIANLTLVRISARMKEIATRYALGASMARLARLALTEAGMISVAGGALGLLLGRWALTLVQALGLERLPRSFEVRFDAPVVLYTLALVATITLVVGLVPVAGLGQRSLGQAFREEGRSGTASRGTRFVRRMLVTAQVALALVLLAGSALLFASFQKLLAVDHGYRGEHVWTGVVTLPLPRYDKDVAVVNFQTRLLERLRTVPGAARAGLTDMIPFGPSLSDSVIFPEGYQPRPGESVISAYQVTVSPGYFESMGVTRLRGRFFDDRDTTTARRVIIIDDRLAKRFWPGQDPIGKRAWRPDDPDLLPPKDESRYLTVVGVVNTIHMRSLTGEDERFGAVYYPYTQDPSRTSVIVVRSDIAPTALTSAIRSEVRRLDGELPLFNVRTMTERRDQAVQNRRTPLVLSVVFGAIALFLAALGLYGVLAYQVTQRRREIGIRLVLGGQAAAIVGLVLREGFVMVAAGGVVGVAGVLALGRVLESQLYGVRPADPLIITGMVGLVGVVALLACLMPARRAAQVDPVRALNDL